MKTVLFLGAGATRAQFDWETQNKTLCISKESDCYSPVPPFLANDFFKLAKERCANDFPVVRSYFMATGDVDLKEHKEHDVEIWFNRILREVLAPPSVEATTFAKAAWHHILVCYRKLIGCSTNHLGYPADSPLPALIHSLHIGGGNLSVVTTNQDLAIECTILNAVSPPSGQPPIAGNPTSTYATLKEADLPSEPEHRKDRCRNFYTFSLKQYQLTADHANTSTLDKLYAVKFTGKPLLGRNGNIDCHRTDAVWPHIPILKLHGSLNWWYPATATLNPLPKDDAVDLSLLYDMEVPVAMGLYGEIGQKHLYPLVVPFVEDKQGFLEGKLAPVWDAAEKAMSECERLIVFGYGFAEADEEARKLFSKNLNKKIEKIAVVDICESPAKQLRQLLHGNCEVEYYRDVDAFMKCNST